MKYYVPGNDVIEFEDEEVKGIFDHITDFLRHRRSNKAIYYFVIADADGLVVSREEFQIDIAFAVDEFDFFS